MKTVALVTLLLLTTSRLFAGTLTVTITDTGKGSELYIALYNKPDGFTSPAAGYRGKIVKTPGKRNTLDVTFGDLPDGIYAVALFEDGNGNGKLDKNLLGIPLEGYGFSNNATSPGFENAKFPIHGDTKITIKVRR